MRHISQTELDHLGIRFRLYGIGKVKDRLIGEAVIDLGELNLPQYFCDDAKSKILEQMSSQQTTTNQISNSSSHKLNNNNKSSKNPSSSQSINSQLHNDGGTPYRNRNNNNKNSSQNNSIAAISGNPNVRSSAYIMGINQIPEIPDDFSSSTHVSLTLTIKLDPRANLIDKPSLAAKQDQVIQQGAPKEAAVIYNSSLTMIQYGGESPQVLIGLSYNGQTGRLCIQLIKGSHFGDRAYSEAPHTYIKLTLLDENLKEVAKSKTTIRENTPNPVFREKFFFEVAANQLNLVTITARVMVKPNFLAGIGLKKNKDSQNVVGWITMGAHNSDFEQSSHWQEMARAKGQEVCRWHTLLEEESLQ